MRVEQSLAHERGLARGLDADQHDEFWSGHGENEGEPFTWGRIRNLPGRAAERAAYNPCRMLAHADSVAPSMRRPALLLLAMAAAPLTAQHPTYTPKIAKASPDAQRAIAGFQTPADLRTDTYRSSGAGGQHVNTTDSAVRITHVPTGVVAACQTERSQHSNRDRAMKMLKARIYEAEMQKRNAAKQELEDSKSDIGWGSQIRSYVLDDGRIKDLRTGVESHNTQQVLDGALDQFIEASLKAGL